MPSASAFFVFVSYSLHPARSEPKAGAEWEPLPQVGSPTEVVAEWVSQAGFEAPMSQERQFRGLH